MKKTIIATVLALGVVPAANYLGLDPQATGILEEAVALFVEPLALLLLSVYGRVRLLVRGREHQPADSDEESP